MIMNEWSLAAWNDQLILSHKVNPKRNKTIKGV